MALYDYVFLSLQSNEDNGGRTRKGEGGSIVSLSCDRRTAEKKSDERLSA